MSKYFIDRNQAINALNEAQIEGTDTYKGLGLAKQIIDNLPFEDRPKGEWIVFSGGYICSKCRKNGKIKVNNIASHYCPDCGADMRDKIIVDIR